ncbi:MAG TPA: hypothetical protein HA298_00535 [Methanobacteriales archaeon]|nr:hypothetical protein [Methanobacteriales archaeon]
MKIAAVAVTYNRKKSLIECLGALRKWTRPLDTIYYLIMCLGVNGISAADLSS